MPDESYRIQPLRGEANYATWRVQMMDILGDMDVWDIVSGTETLPAIETLQPDWQKKDRKALRAIRVRVTPEVINVVQDVDSSRTAWESLCDEYQASGSFGRVMA